MDKVLARDINNFKLSFPFSDELRGTSFLITGATGLIGSTLIRCLVALDNGIHIFAPIRNLDKAKMMFGEKFPNVDFMECNIMDIKDDIFGDIDYIVHCAAPTASKFFVEKPVETIDTIFNGTKTVLDYACSHRVKSMVNLSSLEVYGTINDDSTPITEEIQGYLDPLNVRSSYPMAKRAVENLCTAYANEYDVPVKNARLTQTTGAGISKDDNRIIAQFARLAAKGEDIVLHTTGESSRPYCYTIDSIAAILYILLKGTNGEAYNVANEETYISAKDMAEYVKCNFNPQIDVKVDINNNFGYAPPTKIRLSCQKLCGLGWKPVYGLKEIFRNLIAYLDSSD